MRKLKKKADRSINKKPSNPSGKLKKKTDRQIKILGISDRNKRVNPANGSIKNLLILAGS